MFYVKDVFGLKVEHERKIAEIRAAMLDALREPAEAAPKPSMVWRRNSASCLGARGSKTMTLGRAIATIGGWTVLSRLTGLVREMLVARYLGAGAVADAFFVAFRFPNLFRSLFAEGAFNAGLRAAVRRQAGSARARRPPANSPNSCFAVLTVALILFVAVMEIAMPWAMDVLAPGFGDTPGKLELATSSRASAFPICCSSRWCRCRAAC